MWLYNGKKFDTEDIGDAYGFVYMITNTVTGQMYIGKKFFWSKRTLPPLKGKTRKRKTIKESDWKDYYGSSKEVEKAIETYGIDKFKREILSLHKNKAETNYAELCEQVTRDVLDARDEDGNRLYYNLNIERKFYPSKVKETITERLDQRNSRIKRLVEE